MPLVIAPSLTFLKTCEAIRLYTIRFGMTMVARYIGENDGVNITTTVKIFTTAVTLQTRRCEDVETPE